MGTDYILGVTYRICTMYFFLFSFSFLFSDLFLRVCGSFLVIFGHVDVFLSLLQCSTLVFLVFVFSSVAEGGGLYVGIYLWLL